MVGGTGKGGAVEIGCLVPPGTWHLIPGTSLSYFPFFGGSGRL